ncbi:MAG: hypothetical protein J6A22_08540, partial [Bacteroidales bacterium]|nr:hypothetical protein [Bacteroidales bacterium]
SEQGENDFQKWGRKTAEIRHLPSSLTSEKRGNSFFRKMGKYYLLFTNEPFWNLYMNNGKDLSTVTSPYSVNRLRENTYAIIDQELFELMQDVDSRARLRVLLISQYLQDQHISLDKSLPVLAIIGVLLNLAA